MSELYKKYLQIKESEDAINRENLRIEAEKRLEEARRDTQRKALENYEKNQTRNFIEKIYQSELEMLNSSLAISSLIDICHNVEIDKFNQKPLSRSTEFVDLYINNHFQTYPFTKITSNDFNRTYMDNVLGNTRAKGSLFTFGVREAVSRPGCYNRSLLFSVFFEDDLEKYKTEEFFSHTWSHKKYKNIIDEELNKFRFVPEMPLQIILPGKGRFSVENVINEDKSFIFSLKNDIDKASKCIEIPPASESNPTICCM